MIKRNQAGANAIINVMIVISNLVSEITYLRFQRRLRTVKESFAKLTQSTRFVQGAMLDDTFTSFKTKIKPVKRSVALLKLVNNTLLFEHVAALAEMMVVAERAGVPPATLLDVLSISSADSFALRNHGMKAMLPRAFPEKAFPSHYVLKDMGYALEMAAETGVAPRMAEQARTYYQNAIDAGIGDAYFPVIVDLVGKE